MASHSCTVCKTVFEAQSPPERSGWTAVGWVYGPPPLRSLHAKVQPYCPTCRPVAEACFIANVGPAGGPNFIYHARPGGFIEVQRYEMRDERWALVEKAHTTLARMRAAAELPVEPGHGERAWTLLAAPLKLARRWCWVSGLLGSAYMGAEAWLEAGTLVRDLSMNRIVDVFNVIEVTYTFEASTDGGLTWYRHRTTQRPEVE